MIIWVTCANNKKVWHGKKYLFEITKKATGSGLVVVVLYTL